MEREASGLLVGESALRRRIFFRRLGEGGLLLAASVAVFAVAFIVWFVVKGAWPYFWERGVAELFTGRTWLPAASKPSFGGVPLFVGSLYVTVGACLVAVPLGVGAAVCLCDMVPPTWRHSVKSVVEVLAAVPSVVYGVFAVCVLAPLLEGWGAPSGMNVLSVSLVLGVMALPTVVSVAEDALQAVPRDLREASYALGATRAETLLRVVIPAASSGILAGVLLGIMRALGETMVVWMAAGNSPQIPEPWYNVLASVRTLTATIAGEMGEADQSTGALRFHVLFALAFCLLVISFALNGMGEWVVRRQRKRLSGEG